MRGAVGEYADAGYTVFRNTLDTRKAMVYQAANDGMLHAFDAATGAESWAYVPNLVFPSLSELASPNYQHQILRGRHALGRRRRLWQHRGR